MEKTIEKLYNLIFGGEPSTETAETEDSQLIYRKKVFVVVISLILILVFTVLILLNIIKKIQSL